MFPTVSEGGTHQFNLGGSTVTAIRGGGGNIKMATGDPLVDSQLGIDPVVTSLVVGQPRTVVNFGQNLFRPISVPTWTFKYRRYGLETLEIRKAKRAMRAIIPHSDLSVEVESGKLERYAWRTLADRDELLNSDAAERAIGSPTLSMRERYARAARQIVDLSKEYDRAQLVLATASYSQSGPDLDVTLASGSEWNDPTNGDSQGSIRALAWTLASQHGFTIEQVDVHLTNSSFNAAIEDPVFVARRANYATAMPTREELRAFWGVNRITVGDGFYYDGTDLVSLYGDIAVLSISRDLQGVDQREGTLDNFVRFTWSSMQEGGATEPWFDRANTTWSFPWESHENNMAINPRGSAIIRNTNANA